MQRILKRLYPIGTKVRFRPTGLRKAEDGEVKGYLFCDHTGRPALVVAYQGAGAWAKQVFHDRITPDRLV
ncbi:hypothetical protein FRUB_10212 [Fimbriiglobus ruber]|uniref:Uncharacterized protein n=1 Tax=Fimbriiglobus ruber TaxID=1908690 RepID=A0A225CY26_9BACT|nr:hypothetical protein FRUB_10212 [Fimbriiglobus ruber]